MRIRRFNRLRMVVGIVAMLGAIVELPTAAIATLSMAMAAPAAPHAAADQTSHKSCAHCPKKACPDLGACLVKCFQIMYSPLAKSCLPGVGCGLTSTSCSLTACHRAACPSSFPAA